MISVKRFVIERVTNSVFASSFPRFSMTSLIGYRNFSVLCACDVKIFFVNVYFLNLDSLCEIVSFS